MKQKTELSQTKSTGKPARSHVNYEPYSEKKQVTTHNHEKSHHNYLNHASNSQNPYQIQQNNLNPILKNEATVSHMNQQQYIQIMELDFQATVRGYEIKLKNLNEEYRRNRQQMESKLKQLFQEKNHWQNLAIRYSQNFQNCNTGKNKKTEQVVKEKQKILHLQSEKNRFFQQKEEISKELTVILQQNSQLKHKIAELTKNDNKNSRYTSQPRTSRSLPSPIKNYQIIKNMHPSSNGSVPQSAQKELELANIALEKLKIMIADLNQQVIKLKIHNLNLKYEKENGMVHYLTPNALISGPPRKQSTGPFLSFNNQNSRLNNK